jgi:hypothetical protein
LLTGRWANPIRFFYHWRDGLLFCVATRRVFILKAGGGPRTPFFLLFAQKKEGKEKGTLLPRPAARKELASFAGSDTFSLSPQSAAVLGASEGNPGWAHPVCWMIPLLSLRGSVSDRGNLMS